MNKGQFVQTHISRRTFIKAGIASAALLSLSGCIGKRSSYNDNVHGGNLNWSLPDVLTLDPRMVQDAHSAQVVNQLFAPLVTYDWAKQEVKGLAAKSWDINNNGTEYIFHLHKDATFHNGDPVRSQSFKKAWESLVATKDSDKDQNVHEYLLSLIDGFDQFKRGEEHGISGIFCPDDTTLGITLTKASSEFLLMLTHIVLSPIPDQRDDINFDREPVGNGPFQIQHKWDGTENITLSRFDAYKLDKPYIDTVTFKLVSDKNTEYEDFQARAVDVASIPTNRYKQAIQEYGVSSDGYVIEPGHQCLFGNLLATTFLAFNVKNEDLKNKELRQALSLSIDRNVLAKSELEGFFEPADGLVPLALPGFDRKPWRFAQYNTDRAKTVLKELKFKNLSFELIYRQSETNRIIAETVQKFFEEIEIKLSVKGLSKSEYKDRLESGKYDIVLAKWTAEYPSVAEFFYPIFYSGLSTNIVNYSDKKLDKLMNEALTKADRSASLTLFQTVNTQLSELALVCPLLFDKLSLVGSKAIKYAKVNPDGTSAMQYIQLN